MTNTNDFRRYSYNNDTAYMINSFSANRGSQAPKVRPEEDTSANLKVRKNARVKSASQVKTEQRQAFNSVVKIAAVAILCLAMVGILLNSMAVKNELTREISQQQVAIANAKSENISLRSENLTSRHWSSHTHKVMEQLILLTCRTSNTVWIINMNVLQVLPMLT